MVLEIKAKAGETGRIFGAVTSLQISDALKLKGFDVDRKRITIPNDVKNLGEYEATIILHKQVTHKVKFAVTGE
jgi:large subunit ribosomal protein L9